MKKTNLILAVLLALLVAVPTVGLAWPTWTGTSVLTIATDNTHSAGVTIPRECKNAVSVIIPTVDSGTVTLQVSHDGTTYYAMYYNGGAAAAPAAWTTGSGTHNYAAELPLGATDFKYIRFLTSADQTANRTFRLICN